MKSLRLIPKFNINVVAPECGCAKASPNLNFPVFKPAPRLQPDKKLREYVLISV